MDLQKANSYESPARIPADSDFSSRGLDTGSKSRLFVKDEDSGGGYPIEFGAVIASYMVIGP